MIPNLKLLALLGSLAALLALVAVLFWYRGEAIKATDQLKTAQQTIAQQSQTITRMDQAEKANQALMLDLTTQVQAIQKAQQNQISAINQLKATDEATRNYLAHNVPAALRSVLNGGIPDAKAPR